MFFILGVVARLHNSLPSFSFFYDNSNRHTCALPIHNTYTLGKERENVKGIWIAVNWVIG